MSREVGQSRDLCYILTFMNMGNEGRKASEGTVLLQVTMAT